VPCLDVERTLGVFVERLVGRLGLGKNVLYLGEGLRREEADGYLVAAVGEGEGDWVLAALQIHDFEGIQVPFIHGGSVAMRTFVFERILGTERDSAKPDDDECLVGCEQILGTKLERFVVEAVVYEHLKAIAATDTIEALLVLGVEGANIHFLGNL
jgi:hypothetical protein